MQLSRQFSLRSLLLSILAVAIALSLIRWGYDRYLYFPLANAITSANKFGRPEFAITEKEVIDSIKQQLEDLPSSTDIAKKALSRIVATRKIPRSSRVDITETGIVTLYMQFSKTKSVSAGYELRLRHPAIRRISETRSRLDKTWTSKSIDRIVWNGVRWQIEFPFHSIQGLSADQSKLVKHMVIIHAETIPNGGNRYFPALVVESDASRSILVSASWGAEPFPVPPNGVPIGSIHILNSQQPVDIIAYDEKLGVGVFSVQLQLEPWPADLFAQDVGVGDILEELKLNNANYRPSTEKNHRVEASNQKFPYQTSDSRQVEVDDTIIFDGQTAGGPGSVLLKDGKLAAIFLNNHAEWLPLKAEWLPLKLSPYLPMY